MTTLIVPASGRSSRFGEGKPKWMKTHPEGCLMIEAALKGITGYDRLIIGVVKEHIETHRLDFAVLERKIGEQGMKPQFVIMDDFTASQSETVYRLLDGVEGAVFVKDCDNYFDYCLSGKNEVCISRLTSETNAVNKSYVSLDKMGKLAGIVEKMVVGSKFCCGGYGFEEASGFQAAYEAVMKVRGIDAGELYISHVIQSMLLGGGEFGVAEVSGYLDWGDKEVWRKFCSQYKTVFVDIDGVLVENGSEYFEPKWGKSAALVENIAAVNRLYESGKVRVILTTSRRNEFAKATEEQLKAVGLKYHSIIYDLYHSQRVLVNDFADSNPYPSAVAINIERDGDTLSVML
jgi:hypothetical protein